MPVTRQEITRYLDDVFVAGRLRRDELQQVAYGRGSRSAVLTVLGRLPDRCFATLPALWQYLSDVPEVPGSAEAANSIG